ncbi:carbohydrate-binding protein [Ramlibacter sp. MAHUQ-53]|uniref:carbohydrate-binding protein n=1 Tax=unclassified Ramlibacter TaxID=2617605 RepID=UPI003636C235
MNNDALLIVRPVQVTDAMLVSSNVPETDYAAWSNAATYGVGDRVILTSTHKVYESLQASNLNHDPVTAAAWWIEVGPTNRWRVLDTSNSTQTTNANSISYTLRPGQAINTVAALNVSNATSMRVRLIDPVYGTVFDKTQDFTRAPLVSTWWAWFFGQKRARTQFVVSGLPSYPNADLVIDLVGNSALAIGVIVFGQEQRFGLTLRSGARVGIQDYSRRQTNDFGDTTLVVRAFAKRASFELLLESLQVDDLQNYLAEVRAVPCLWIGSGQFEAAVVFGFYKSFDILISYPTYADCTLEIEGLT